MSVFDTAPPAIQQNMIRDVQEMVRHEAGRSIDAEQAEQLARKLLARAKSREALYRVSSARLRSLVDALAGGHHATKKSPAQGHGPAPEEATTHQKLEDHAWELVEYVLRKNLPPVGRGQQVPTLATLKRKKYQLTPEDKDLLLTAAEEFDAASRFWKTRGSKRGDTLRNFASLARRAKLAELAQYGY